MSGDLVDVDHGAPTEVRLAPPTTSPTVALAREMARRIEGEVRFDRGSRSLYATDASNYRQEPLGVVVPRSIDDVVRAVEVCREFDAAVLNRGGGTSLAGQCCNAAVVIDTSKYLRGINWVDGDRAQASTEPGCVLDDLRERAENELDMTLGPDPSTHNRCTIGGMIGNNVCGVHAQMAGRMADNVDEMEVLTYDGLRLRVGPTTDDELGEIISAGGRRGEIYRGLRDLRDRYQDQIRARFPDIPRRVSGYCLEQLLPEHGFNVARALVGTEGTCVTILDAVTHLVPARQKRSLVLLGYPDVFRAADHLPQVLEHHPIALEGFDQLLIENALALGLTPSHTPALPDGEGWLMVQFGADDQDEADESARALMKALADAPDAPTMRLFDDPTDERHLWEIREAGLGATAFVPGQPDRWPGWEDSAVPPERVGEYLRALEELFRRYDYHASVYGHFGQGCVHCRIDFELWTAQGIARWKAFLEDAADLVVGMGGSLSGEHGDGQQRGWLLEKMYGPQLVEAFREFKSIWDPRNKMNPGKVVDPNPVDADLRLGEDYRPPTPKTQFEYPDDDFQFSRAALRCVGVGLCRREGGGTMCPSYMVTRDEQHSTRGRARLLWEMLNGSLQDEGWRSDAVHDALDLCLACKGCKGDCPVNVDMATYKAEFMSHHYARRLRPRSAYAIGLIWWWARLASKAPRLANLGRHRPLAPLAKWLADVAPERDIPKLADQTFLGWFAARPTTDDGRPPVLLWPDTFNNHFHPEVAQAAVRVLEATGHRVVVPEVPLCCGRPLHDFGMLATAKRVLRRTLDHLAPTIQAGTPIVGLEPSCLTVFRDEVRSFFPRDLDAERLTKQSFTLAEFLVDHDDDVPWPDLHGARALVHGHCHHKSVLGFEADTTVLERTGIDHDVLDSGCCGLAGAFGFERRHYDVSVAVGERVLLPAVRRAPPDCSIVTDGFSCRTQIEQLGDRHAVHLAQLLAEHLDEREEAR